MKQAKGKEVKNAQKTVQRLKKKAEQMSNNDLMEVFMLRAAEEKEKMDRELRKTGAASSAENNSQEE